MPTWTGTVTLVAPVTPTVMVVFPLATAVTRPPLLTVATAVELDTNVALEVTLAVGPAL